MEVNRCQGITADTKPCSAKPRPGSTWCPWHDPAMSHQRAEWSAKGGQQRSNRARTRKSIADEAMTPTELMGALSKALKDVLSGDLEPGRGNAAASITNALTKLREAVEVDERLADLERRLGSRSA